VEAKRKIERDCDAHIASIEGDISTVSARYGKDLQEILNNIELLEDSKSLHLSQLVFFFLKVFFKFV
jgi:hypothetical protein